MRRSLLVLVVALAGFAWLGVGAATASAASCAPTMIQGGERAPFFTDLTHIAGSGIGGYNCTVVWDEYTFPQYEGGGTWHDVVIGGVHQAFIRGPYNCCEGHTWVEPNFDPRQQFLACSANWRYHVLFFRHDNGGGIGNGTVSPELHSTC